MNGISYKCCRGNNEEVNKKVQSKYEEIQFALILVKFKFLCTKSNNHNAEITFTVLLNLLLE